MVILYRIYAVVYTPGRNCTRDARFRRPPLYLLSYRGSQYARLELHQRLSPSRGDALSAGPRAHIPPAGLEPPHLLVDRFSAFISKRWSLAMAVNRLSMCDSLLFTSVFISSGICATLAAKHARFRVLNTAFRTSFYHSVTGGSRTHNLCSLKERYHAVR